MTLSRARSPQRTEDSLKTLFQDRDEPLRAPATPDELLELRNLLWEIAGRDYGRLAGHMTTNRLHGEVDHLIAVHVMGYIFNEDDRPDGSMAHWKWRTGLGTYSSDAKRPWSTECDLAMLLMHQFTPKLRLSMRIGDGTDGQISNAQFASDHPIRALRGKRIPLPKTWPLHVVAFPAIGILLTFLTALALQQREAARQRPKKAKKMPAPAPSPKPTTFAGRAASFG